MVQILECVMLICFGISWPISVVKSLKTKSTQGKSLIFMLAIILGYIAGIASKALAGNINYVFGLYIFNVLVVITDLIIFFVNKYRESGHVKHERKRYHFFNAHHA